MNLSEWLGSKKTKDALVGVAFILVIIAMMLYASGGDPEQFKALLEAAQWYVLSAMGLLGLKVTGQSVIDTAKVGKS